MSAPSSALKRRLLSPKTVGRWFGGPHGTRATLRERLLVAKLKPLSPDAAAELDEICSAHAADGEERTLFVVGTLLMRRGQRRLWRQVYRACQENFVVETGDEIRFLEHMSLAARAREL